MRDITASEDNQNQNNQITKPKPKATRPKPVYLWTTTDVQKWFRRHCSDFYTVYSDLILQVLNAISDVEWCLLFYCIYIAAWNLWPSFAAYE